MTHSGNYITYRLFFGDIYLWFNDQTEYDLCFLYENSTEVGITACNLQVDDQVILFWYIVGVHVSLYHFVGWNR